LTDLCFVHDAKKQGAGGKNEPILTYVVAEKRKKCGLCQIALNLVQNKAELIKKYQ